MEPRDFAGLKVVVENPRGSTRHWHDRDGRESGSTLMRNDYGFIEGQGGSDGDELDCYLGPDESAPFVHVVHQLAAPDFERRDEDKVMLGFPDEASAKEAYLAHRNDGDRAYGGMSVIPLASFQAKMRRRTGDGKVRHEVTMVHMFRVEHRGEKWVVLPEVGDKVLGTHDTKEGAEAQLAAIEASKADHARHSMFDVARGSDGRVREGVWDFVCVDGWDMKGGQFTEFTAETLSEMVRNFGARGDFVPYDWNHQSGYTERNGQPAPALAFAGALAAVWDGRVVSHAGGKNPRPVQYDAAALAGRPNGLYSYRVDVTDGTAECPLGQQLLPGFKYISPMFTSHGESRHGDDVGYSLLAIACTNMPWQPGTAIAFEGSRDNAGAAGQPGRGQQMKLKKLAALMTQRFGIKFEGGADEDDEKVKAKAMEAAEGEAVKSMEEESYDYGAGASALEEMAKAFEDAHPEPDGDEPFPSTMRRMSAKFRRMAAPPAEKMDAKDGDAAPAEMQALARSFGVDPAGKKRAQLMDAITAAAVPASKVGEMARVAAREAIEADRAARQADERKSQAAVLMSRLRDDTPEVNRKALERLALGDPESAAALAEPFLKRGVAGAPAHLFGRLTEAGGPTGGDARRGDSPVGPKTFKTPFGIWEASDHYFAEEIERVADSKEPVMMSRVSALCAPHERGVKGARLIAAERIVRTDRPDLVPAGE